MNCSFSHQSSFRRRNKCPLLLAVVAVLGFSCQPAKQKSTAEKAFMLDTLINGKKLMVKDTTTYSPEFIRQLKRDASVNESIKVIGDSIWVTSKMFNSRRDTVVTFVDLIPTVLKLSESYRFISADQERNFALTLKRTNYTDIEYSLELGGKAIQQGTAMLQSNFYLGKEADSGQMFLDQYIDGGTHWAAIKIETNEGKTVIFVSADSEVKKQGKLPLLRRN